ncbi:hypothetical protein PQC07_gp183 [Aeromonas phage D3]|uniref:Uncharacterized protein n=3 Tax=Ludhianavirus TaxID=3044751 RepID=A0A514A1R1_9CAUD|nr:hypothetical protein PQC06_gp023 [Aeromonas phage LAh10]YP_010668573.1 hypothetical protein PQC07_gp183 [Aeromonas phage D3]YP_010668839.1 hypothetical protein PQC08_gp184 [Aeromonas phage D6]QDH47162.1 hypothetical protein LAh10_23 [Aeromonas phage LAh10]QDJ97090.1 hypothetical protein D3_0092 [Aeromonas phage D3]QDJ97251.1 hypothetical protein D6_0091 [Aeromonas phage D6]
MNIEISTICRKRLKRSVICLYNDLTDDTLDVAVDPLTLHNHNDSCILVKDGLSHGGLLVDKIDLKDLFPGTLDIRHYKGQNKDHHQVVMDTSQEGLNRFINDFSAKHDCDMVGLNHPLLNDPVSYSKELLRNFVLFCRLHGFWELDAVDLSLHMDEEKLYMTVVKTHPVYTGSIEVLI